MTQPTIIIKKLNLMGYTPETQVWFIQNGGGGLKTFNFLKHWADKGAFGARYQFMGSVYNGLVGPRAEKFAEYAMAQGFEVRWEA